MGRYSGFIAALLTCGFSNAACIYDGLAQADEFGFSHGPPGFGTLHDGTRLPARGEGYWIPPTWSQRGLNYGIEELVSLLVHTGRRLHREGLVLSIGDLSRASGGSSPWHRSHQTGRDVDLLFFVNDSQGRTLANDTMYAHSADGALKNASGTRKLFFDVAANWQLVVALLDNPIAEVQYIFIQDDLRQMLLEHGMAVGSSNSVIARAALILRQPGDSAPHDDHMHVRIFCPKADLATGCVDFGTMRWHKKDYKYDRRVERLRQFDELVPAGVPELTITALPWLFR